MNVVHMKTTQYLSRMQLSCRLGYKPHGVAADIVGTWHAVSQAIGHTGCMPYGLLAMDLPTL